MDQIASSIFCKFGLRSNHRDPNLCGGWCVLISSPYFVIEKGLKKRTNKVFEHLEKSRGFQTPLLPKSYPLKFNSMPLVPIQTPISPNPKKK
jgi:hypothetical protein